MIYFANTDKSPNQFSHKLCMIQFSRKPSMIHLLKRGVAQSGSAPGLGPGGRRFESCRPDITKMSSCWFSAT